MIDGVTVEAKLNQKRGFTSSPVCLYGKIQAEEHLKIDWQALPNYSLTSSSLQDRDSTTEQTPKAHYRMAATGDAHNQQLIIMAGGDNPYNYRGIGCNGQPSPPRMHFIALI
ncbi:MAG: hypothetical protein ACI90A_000615 [Shewanella sp.]